MQDGSSKQQKKNTNLIISRQDYQLTQPCPSDKKQTKQTKKLSTNLTLCEAYTNHWTKLSGAETKRKKEFNPEAWEKETSNTVSNNNNSEKAEKYYTKEGTN